MSDFILLETLMHIEAMANVMDSLLLFVGHETSPHYFSITLIRSITFKMYPVIT